MKLDIDQVLNLSTVHITEQDNTNLEGCADASNHQYGAAGWVIETGYGFMVFVPPLVNGEEVAEHVYGFKQVGMSKEFLAIYQLAASRDCTWLRLDCDIPEVKGLPTFEW